MGCNCLVFIMSSYTQFKTLRPSSSIGTLSPGDYLLASAEASAYLIDIIDITSLFLGAVTALLTNPIWVVKTRLFTTTPDSPNAYRGLFGA